MKKFLENFILFKDLTEAELNKISEISYRASYDQGAMIFWEQERGDAFYIILDGLVKVFRTTEEGKNKTLSLLGRKEFFGEMALLEGKNRSASVKTIHPTQLLVIEKNKFQQLITNHPPISLKIIAVLSQRLRRANNQIQELTYSSVRERLTTELGKLARKYGQQQEEGTLITKKITHQELANLVGTTRVTITKLLNKLKEEDKIIMKDRYLILTDEYLKDSQLN